MISLPNLMIVTGNARNVGKTTLAKAIIRHFAEKFPIVGVKVNAIRAEDASFHGTHPEALPATFSIEQEVDLSGLTDTSGMLLAGAESAWYIRSRVEFIEQALLDFLDLIPSDVLIVAESRALCQVVRPSALIVIRRRRPWVGLKPVDDLVSLANLVLETGPGYLPIPETLRRIETDGTSWQIVG